MDRVAVFVDAGYLFAQGSVELCGAKLTRARVTLDYEGVVAALKAFAEETSSLSLLRIYWYDGTSQGPTSQHIALAEQTNVKVRLGFVNSFGQQKGVDSLIVTDMITLARNRAMAACVLLSGDEDLRVGVQQAQEYGVRVHLLGIKPARGSQSIFLLQEADTTHQWDASDLTAFMTCDRSTSPPPQSVDAGNATLVAASETVTPSALPDEVARQVATDVPDAEVATLVASIRATGRRPREIDAKLLALSRNRLGDSLDPSQKERVREAFLRALESRLTERSRGAVC